MAGACTGSDTPEMQSCSRSTTGDSCFDPSLTLDRPTGSGGAAGQSSLS